MFSIDQSLYLSRVERVMDKLKTLCLGQNICLTDVLPSHLKPSSCELCAAHLSRQILFALVRACDDSVPSNEYIRSYEWLYESILFLFRECRFTDQTFYGLSEIMNLSQGARTLLFSEKKIDGGAYSTLRNAEKPPWPLQEFDLAVLLLLESLKLGELPKQHFQKVEMMLSEHDF